MRYLLAGFGEAGRPYGQAYDLPFKLTERFPDVGHDWAEDMGFDLVETESQLMRLWEDTEFGLGVLLRFENGEDPVIISYLNGDYPSIYP